MTESLTSRVTKATQQIEDAGEVFSEVKCADSNTMVETGCGEVPSLRKVLKDLGGYQYKGVWAADTEYEAKDQVKDSDGAIWLCLSDHISGSEFNADVASGKWVAWQAVIDSSSIGYNVAEMERKSNEDAFGRQLFFGDAFKIKHLAGDTYSVESGVGYVAGIRFVSNGDSVQITKFPVSVWLDVSIQGDDVGGIYPIYKLIVSNEKLVDYIDSDKVSHWVEKISIVDFDGVTDVRSTSIGNRVKMFSTLEEAKKNRFYDIDHVSITSRSGATFEKVDSVAAASYPESARFKDQNEQWWGLVVSGLVNVKWLGAKGDGVTDNTEVIQDAINLCKIGGTVFFPKGVYGISSHIEERTNGGRRTIKGEGQLVSIIKALPDFNSVARGMMFWFGNNNGHGSYQLKMYDVQIDASFIADGCVMGQENGQGDIEDCSFRGFLKYGFRTSGATDTTIGGKCEFYSADPKTKIRYGTGIVATCSGMGSAEHSSGYDFSYSKGLSSPSNEFIVRGAWFSGSKRCVWINGDQAEIHNCTAQACGDSTEDDLFIITSNGYDEYEKSNNYPLAGPRITGVWAEGGVNRYVIRVEGYTNGLIESNNIIGDGSVDANTREGGVLIYSSGTIVRNNAFYQFFSATPTEGRLKNGCITVMDDASNVRVYDNQYFTHQTGNEIYWQRSTVVEPTAALNSIPRLFGVIGFDVETEQPFIRGNAADVISVTNISKGRFQINFKWNIESRNMPVLISIETDNSDTKVYVSSYTWNTDYSLRIRVQDVAGSASIPKGVSFVVYGDPVVFS